MRLWQKKILCIATLLLAGCNSVTPMSEPPPVDAFMGDSITAFWTTLPGINAGVSGNTTTQMRARFDADVMSHHPTKVVILGGINDLLQTGSVDTREIESMADEAASAGAKVVISTLAHCYYSVCDANEYDIPIRAYNEQLRMLAAAHGWSVADYYPVTSDPALFVDGVHPDSAGYAAMMTVLEPLL